MLLRAWRWAHGRWPGVGWRFLRLADRLAGGGVARDHRLLTHVEQSSEFAVVVRRSRRELRLYRLDEGLPIQVRSYSVGVGRPECRTPPGEFRVQAMLEQPVWHVPNNPRRYGTLAGTEVPPGAPGNRIVARWIGFHNGIGIHGTHRRLLGIGSSDSCVLMTPGDVIDLYDHVRPGTPVIVR